MTHSFQYKNLTIIGSSHIAIQSKKEIKRELELNVYDIICVELDKTRMQVLLQEEKQKNQNPQKEKPLAKFLKLQKDFGLFTALFMTVASSMQQKLGGAIGVKPGVDMLEAIKFSKKNNRQLELIDQHIEVTVRNISKISASAKWGFFTTTIKNMIFYKKTAREFGLTSFNLKTVPEKELIEKMMIYMEKNFGALYKVLVTDRNHVMAKKLIILMKKNPSKKIFVVVGAGHLEEMGKIIKRDIHKIDII